MSNQCPLKAKNVRILSSVKWFSENMTQKLTLILLGVSCVSWAQNVGIGTALPSERLHVSGNLRFDGALMPAGNAGLAGQVLTSSGASLAPVWATHTTTPIQTYSASRTTNVDVNSTAWTDIVFLSNDIPLTQNSIVLVWASGDARCGPVGGCQAYAFIRLVVRQGTTILSELSRTRQMSRWLNGGTLDARGNWGNSWALVGMYQVPSDGNYNFGVQASLISNFSGADGGGTPIMSFAGPGGFGPPPVQLVVMVIGT